MEQQLILLKEGLGFKLFEIIHTEAPFEYFCNGCGQLRLSANFKPTECKNCGSKSLIVGKPGELNKQKLKEKWAAEIRNEFIIDNSRYSSSRQ